MPAEKQMADIDGSPLDPLRDALRRVVDPCSIATGVPVDLLDMGLVKACASMAAPPTWSCS